MGHPIRCWMVRYGLPVHHVIPHWSRSGCHTQHLTEKRYHLMYFPRKLAILALGAMTTIGIAQTSNTPQRSGSQTTPGASGASPNADTGMATQDTTKKHKKSKAHKNSGMESGSSGSGSMENQTTPQDNNASPSTTTQHKSKKSHHGGASGSTNPNSGTAPDGSASPNSSSPSGSTPPRQ